MIKALWERNAGALFQELNATLTSFDPARAREQFCEAVKGLLRRAVEVDLHLLGNARRVVRHAVLGGLLCTVPPAPGGARLRGPG